MNCDESDCRKKSVLRVSNVGHHTIEDLCENHLAEAIEMWARKHDGFREALRESIFGGGLGELLSATKEEEVEA